MKKGESFCFQLFGVTVIMAVAAGGGTTAPPGRDSAFPIDFSPTDLEYAP
jgi:hypothetical protein